MALSRLKIDAVQIYSIKNGYSGQAGRLAHGRKGSWGGCGRRREVEANGEGGREGLEMKEEVEEATKE